ncbi:hypothetical protein [Escherichia coli]|uniref:hypothetical protein n=1 Tax=Escherichia coli TaxID=562 RepID=UPI0039A69AD4
MRRYTQFVTHWQTNYLSQQDVMKVTSRSPPAVAGAGKRLYQDSSRADELVQAVSPVHPAFMPAFPSQRENNEYNHR